MYDLSSEPSCEIGEGLRPSRRRGGTWLVFRGRPCEIGNVEGSERETMSASAPGGEDGEVVARCPCNA